MLSIHAPTHEPHYSKLRVNQSRLLHIYTLLSIDLLASNVMFCLIWTACTQKIIEILCCLVGIQGLLAQLIIVYLLCLETKVEKSGSEHGLKTVSCSYGSAWPIARKKCSLQSTHGPASLLVIVCSHRSSMCVMSWAHLWALLKVTLFTVCCPPFMNREVHNLFDYMRG